MRKLDLLRIDEELFEVVRRIPYQRFSKNVDSDGAHLLREWVGCEKILRSNQTNEYLFVNLIEEAVTIEEEPVIEEEKPTKKLI